MRDDNTFIALDTRTGKRGVALRAPTREEMAKAHTPADWLELFPTGRRPCTPPASVGKFEQIFGVDKARDDQNFGALRRALVYPKGPRLADLLDEDEVDEETIVSATTMTMTTRRSATIHTKEKP